MTDQTETEAVEDEPEVSPGATLPEPEPSSNLEESPEEDEPDTFPRDYVEKLRKEAAGYRDRAKDRDALAERLHGALVAATGRLQDPSDVPFDQEHLDDPDALAAAIDDLLERKPHLASRKVSGDVGQGAASSSDNVDLAGILRART